MRKFIASHPMLFGVLIAPLLVGVIIVIETWFPWIDEGLGRHKRLSEAVFFTAFYFTFYVYCLRSWRRRIAFWPTILVLFLLHVAGVFFYSTYVQPILVWQWSIVGLIEFYPTAFFLEWWTRRFGHLNARERPRQEPG